MPRPDDDFDDRPRRPRDDDRDDDDYDRPRRRSAQSGSNKTVIIVVVAVLGLLLLGCVGMIALLLPAVSKVREASGRAKDSNNLKQIALAFHNHDDATGVIAGPFAVDATRKVKTGHSMRVGLLPYIESSPLFNQIDLDQPWDSPRNAPLTSQIIPTYVSPLTPVVGNATPYRAFVGGGALFDADGKPFTLASIKDGTSNTILLVHAAETVPWAKPQELPYSPTAPLPNLGPVGGPGGFNVLMADGSVRWLKNTPDQVMRYMIERADGNPIP